MDLLYSIYNSSHQYMYHDIHIIKYIISACIYIYIYICVCVLSRSVMSDSLQPHEL